MKAFVFVVALLCFSMVAHAECFTTGYLNMWYDLGRFASLIKGSKGSPDEVAVRLSQARVDGHAVLVPPGARIDAIKEFVKNTSIIRVGDVSAVVFNHEINCK